MCSVCKDWELGKLTIQEAFRNLGELVDPDKSTTEELFHYMEVSNKLIEEEYAKSKN